MNHSPFDGGFLFMHEREFFLKRCLELAERGKGWVEPNPYVGCVIVKEGKIIAEGYHKHFGEAHAEVQAIQNMPPDASPETCELYVNLEPCSHFGKTPPCADLIIKKGFRNVYIGTSDPNPQVSGKGIEKMQSHGIKVTTGILEKECLYLNRKFFFFHKKKQPFITLKWARSTDGYISRRPPVNREENLVSGPESQKVVHALRAEHRAILVGKNTVLTDNPMLTVRYAEGRNPLRMIAGFDPGMKEYHIMQQKDVPTVFLCSEEKEKQRVPQEYPARVIDRSRFRENFIAVCLSLDIQSVLVEGGKKILETFLRTGCWNELVEIVATQKTFTDGIPSPPLPSNARLIKQEKTGTDLWNWYENSDI